MGIFLFGTGLEVVARWAAFPGKVAVKEACQNTRNEDECTYSKAYAIDCDEYADDK